MPDPIRAVIFDFDDTLADSMPPRVTALSRVLTAHLERALPTHEVVDVIRGGPNIEAQLAGYLGEGDHIAPLVEAYRSHYYHPERPPVPVYPGLAEVLRALPGRGVRVAMVTSRYRLGANGNPVWGVGWELKLMGMTDLFEVVVGFEDTEEHKPSPQPFEACIRQLGLPSASVLAVGDTPFDMQGARAAGAVAVAALWGASDPAALLAAGPHVILTEPADLLRLLDEQ